MDEQSELIQVVALEHPFRTDRRLEAEVEPGADLETILLGVLPKQRPGTTLRVTVDGRPIDGAFGECYPEPGSFVFVRPVPEDPVSAIIAIATAIASVGASTAGAVGLTSLAGALGLGGLGGITLGTFGGAAITLAGVANFAIGVGVLGFVGYTVATGFAKPPSAGGGGGAGPGTSPQLTGSSNRAFPYQPIPILYGRYRMTPPLAALTYTESAADESYLRMLMTCGPGPIRFSAPRIGEDPLGTIDPESTAVQTPTDGNFDNVSLEIRKGDAADPPLTLYTKQVIQTNPAATLEAAVGEDKGRVPPSDPITDAWGPWITRRTDTDVDEISIDLHFPTGMWHIDPKGDESGLGFFLQVEIAEVGVGVFAWQDPLEPLDERLRILRDGEKIQTRTAKGSLETSREAVGDTIFFADYTKDPTTVNLRYSVGGGQYDVRIRKGWSTRRHTKFQRTIWNALRSIRAEDPINIAGLSKIALRIRATDQLQGVVQTFSILAERELPTWSPGGGWAAPSVTRSPAWAYLSTLRDSREAYTVVPDAEIDLVQFAAWNSLATTNGWTLDGVFDFETSGREARTMIAGAARAAPTRTLDGKHSVILDVAKSTVSAMFSPRNVRRAAGRLELRKLPHALRAQFSNEDKDYQRDERVVYRDGYSADGAGATEIATRFETWETFGITNADRVWQEARFHLAVLQSRRETWEIDTDFEYLACERGDRVRFTWDVPLGDVRGARVLAYTPATRIIRIDERVLFEVGQSYAVIVRKDDGSEVSQAVTNPASSSDVETDTFTLTSAPSSDPEVGDLLIFGQSGQESIDCLLYEIRPNDDLGATLTLQRYDASVFTADDTGGPTYEAHVSQIAVPRDARPPDPVIDGFVSEPGALVMTLHLVQDPTRVEAVRLEVQYRAADQTLDGAPLTRWSPVFDFPATTTRVELAPVVEGFGYEVRVRSVGAATVSSWVSPEAPVIYSGQTIFATLFEVTGLELENEGNATIFSGRDASFRWRLNSPELAPDVIADPGARERYRVDTADPFFRGYRCRVTDPSDGMLLHEELVVDRRWTYTMEKQRAAASRTGRGPLRTFKLSVAFVDVLENESEDAELTVTNPAPGLPPDLKAYGAFENLWVSFSPPTDLDFEAIYVYAATTIQKIATLSPANLFAVQKGSPVTIKQSEVTDREGVDPDTVTSYRIRVVLADAFAIDPVTGVVDLSLLDPSPAYAILASDIALPPGSVTTFAEDRIEPNDFRYAVLDTSSHQQPWSTFGRPPPLWIDLLSATITSIGQRVTIGWQLTAEIDRSNPEIFITLGSGYIDWFDKPTLEFRIVRDTVTPTGEIQVATYGPEISPFEGFRQIPGTTIIETPPAGTWVYKLQARNATDLYRWGTISRKDDTHPTHGTKVYLRHDSAIEGIWHVAAQKAFGISTDFRVAYLPDEQSFRTSVENAIYIQRAKMQNPNVIFRYNELEVIDWQRIESGSPVTYSQTTSDFPAISASEYELAYRTPGANQRSLRMHLLSGYLQVKEDRA